MTKVQTSIVSVFVAVESRTVNFPMRVRTPDGDTAEKFAKKLFYDLQVTSVYDHGKVLQETFTLHFHKKEVRVMIPAISKYDKPQSLRYDEFCDYCENRWRKQFVKVLAAAHTAVYGSAKKPSKKKAK